MALLYLYANLKTSLSKLKLLELYREQDSGLEGLSDTCSSIVTESVLYDVYLDATMIDLQFMHDCSETEASLDEIQEELLKLLKSIKEVSKQHAFRMGGYPRAVHLMLPNTLILEYVEPDSTRVPRSHRIRAIH